jgi:CubicO group peptidase (beta-lactamase class C family)
MSQEQVEENVQENANEQIEENFIEQVENISFPQISRLDFGELLTPADLEYYLQIVNDLQNNVSNLSNARAIPADNNLISFLTNPPITVQEPASLLPEDYRNTVKAGVISAIQTGLYSAIGLELNNPDPKDTYSLYAGYRFIENQTPITKNTIFRIASMSKMVTAISLMQYVESSKIFLDEPVSKYIPAFANTTVLRKVDPVSYSFQELSSALNSYLISVNLSQSGIPDLNVLIGRHVGIRSPVSPTVDPSLPGINLNGIFTIISADNVTRSVSIQLNGPTTVAGTFAVNLLLDVLPPLQANWAPYDYVNAIIAPGVTPRTYYSKEPANKPLTLRHLLTHTSGIPYPAPTNRTSEINALYTAVALKTDRELIRFPLVPLSNFDAIEWANRIAQVPMTFQPGENWAYGSQLGIIGAVLMQYERERGRNVSLYQIQKEGIFDPLGINSAGYFIHDNDPRRNEKISNLAHTYINIDTVLTVPPVPTVKSPNNSLFTLISDITLPGLNSVLVDGANPINEGAGNPLHPIYGSLTPRKLEFGDAGLYMNTEDYLKIVEVLRNGGRFNNVRILRRPTVNLMLQNQIGNFFIDPSFIAGGQQKWGFGFAVGDESVGSPLSLVDSQWGGAFGGQWFASTPPDNTSLSINANQISYAILNPLKEFIIINTNKK